MAELAALILILRLRHEAVLVYLTLGGLRQIFEAQRLISRPLDHILSRLNGVHCDRRVLSAGHIGRYVVVHE